MWLCCCCCYVGDFFIIIIYYYEFYKYIFLVVCVYVNVVSNFTKKSLLFVYRYFITYILLLLFVTFDIPLLTSPTKCIYISTKNNK